MNVGDQFKGLPMEDLIGGPLSAVVKANFSMAKSTSDFITTVGFEQVFDSNTNSLIPSKPRAVDFSYERPNSDRTGNRVVDLIKLTVPMLAIVPIPSLQVDQVDIVFDMEVKSATKEEDSNSKEGKLEANASIGIGPFKADIKISGSIATTQKNTRSTDTSAKYHVEVKASSRPIPEGLSRVLDMMNQSIQPRDVKQYKLDEKGKLPTTDKGEVDESKGVAVDNDGNAPAEALSLN